MDHAFDIALLKSFFETGSTRSRAFRVQQLQKLGKALEKHESRIYEALYADLRKPRAEAFVSEIGYLQGDIRHTLTQIPKWMRPRRVPTPLGLKPANARITLEPKGVVLIISPWNYPFQLALSPLIAALAAGCCAVIKPSEHAPQSALILKELIESTFDPGLVQVVTGGRETAECLLKEPFNHIFFTGSTPAGRAIMRAAAQQLIPVTLELGGKCPVILCDDADPALAARRIVRGKFMNAGQTCVAPDHVWVPQNMEAQLINELRTAILTLAGPDPQQGPYGRIIHERHCRQLIEGLLSSGKLVYGGQSDLDDLYIAPTILKDPPLDSPVMQEEIFGPILPVLSYAHLDEPIRFCRSRPTPLALYLFTKSRMNAKRLIHAIPSGGVCINDTISQLIPHELPFGGRGQCGMGSYHGKAGFDTFSHFRSILTRRGSFDLQDRKPVTSMSLSTLKRIYRIFYGS